MRVLLGCETTTHPVLPRQFGVIPVSCPHLVGRSTLTIVPNQRRAVGKDISDRNCGVSVHIWLILVGRQPDVVDDR